MPSEVVVIASSVGLHARPAALLIKAAAAAGASVRRHPWESWSSRSAPGRRRRSAPGRRWRGPGGQGSRRGRPRYGGRWRGWRRDARRGRGTQQRASSVQVELARAEARAATERSEQRVTSLIERERTDRITSYTGEAAGSSPDITARLDALEHSVARIQQGLDESRQQQKDLARAISAMFDTLTATSTSINTRPITSRIECGGVCNVEYQNTFWIRNEMCYCGTLNESKNEV